VAVADAFGNEPAEHGGGGGCQGVDPDQAALFSGGGSAAVEAEPAKPQDGRAEHDERDVVRPVVGVLAEALAVANDEDEDQRGHTGVDVDYGAAGEVDGGAERLADGTFGAEQAAAPHHVGQRAVHQGDPYGDEHGPGTELGTVGDGAADQCHRDDGEGGRVADLDEPVGGGDSFKAERGERVAHDFQEPFTRAHGGSPEDPHNADHADGDEAHHHHVQGCLGAGHAAVEKCQTGCHEQHERCRHHDPNVTCGKFHGARPLSSNLADRSACQRLFASCKKCVGGVFRPRRI
jgi:hypothetical protein